MMHFLITLRGRSILGVIDSQNIISLKQTKGMDALCELKHLMSEICY